MSTPMRLFHAGAGGHFIVDSGVVYADLDGDGRITKSERYSGGVERALQQAAAHFDDCYDAPYPGARSTDPDITSGGRLNAQEAARFARDPKGVPAKRPDLLGHLDFFDRQDGDGVISVGQNYRGWRDLGYGVWKALTLTIGSSVIFGRAGDGFAIDIERIGEKRPRRTSGIYDANGNVEPARLSELAAVFDEGRTDGVLTHHQLKVRLAARVALGSISRRQFDSLCLLTARINGSETVTKAQFLALFDNSLLWAVASMPGRSGKRTL